MASNDNNQDQSKELSDLLDNALKSFERPPQPKEGSSSAATEASGEQPAADEDDFFVTQAKMLSERLNSDISSDQFMTSLEKIAKGCQVAMNEGPTVEGQEYADSLTEALKGLKEGVDNVQGLSPDQMANLFGGMGMGEDGDEAGNPFLPFIQGMMQSMLSAEILLPTIQEVVEKFPKYFEEFGDKISAEDKERYEKQYEMFKQIGKELESEQPDDSAEVKQQRQKRVLEGIQKLHEYGQPPAEISGDMDAPVLPDLESMGAGDGPQCPMM